MSRRPPGAPWGLGAPLLLLAIALLPVLAGLAATLGPATSSAAWSELLGTPGLGRSLSLSLGTGVVAALLSLLLAHGLLAVLTTPRAIGRARALALPLIAMPHLALAIGVALVLAPSGLLLRLVSPWLTGFEQLPKHWQVCEEKAAEHGQQVDRANWRCVVPMHIAETREQARADAAANVEKSGEE